MRKTKLIIVLLALSFTLTLTLTAEAATDEWTVSTVDEDLFYATYKFEGVDMMYLQGDNMQIRSWFWFEGPVLDWGRYIEEAYLEVRTPSIGLADPDAIMYIYGIPSQKGGTPSHADDPSYINGPYTANYYEVNLSSFVGPGELHNITVSRIIREINQGYYYWDGHDIAFATFSPAREDGEERYISTLEGGHGAKLYIHYGASPTPPENETSMYIERRHGLDIYQAWGYENFYEDYTELDPLNLIATSADNPYRISFNDFGYEQYWNNLHYFRRDEDISNTADTIESRFKVGLSDDDNINYHIPDFYWVYTEQGGNWIGISHRGQTPDHYVGWITNWGSHGASLLDPIPTPIPPTGTHWYSMLWNYTDDRMTIKSFDTEPLSNEEWINGYDDIYSATGVHISQERYDAYFAVRSRLGSNFYEGWSDGWMENLIIVVDSVPVINGTFLVIDPETNETLVTDLPDLNATQDWIDIYQAGKGENPEDPNPGGEWGDDPGLVTRFNVKLIFFVIGMALFVGTPVWGFATRPDAATWVTIMMSMLCGVALLWSLQLM